ncbi:MAG: serine/threonine protein kinase [Betaproteobacteria bacterium]|nr:MAG: serine/threonine protein kinase [Betaproteobacteria bacterium]
MDSTRWQHLSDIVSECLDLPAEVREAHARTRAAGDEALLRDALSWIAEADDIGGFLAESSALAAVSALTSEPLLGASERIEAAYARAQSMVGRRFGAYRFTEEIARGGMGDVYKARRDDQEFEKEVAIKVIRSDLASSRIAQRFKSERQILANLDHPNIARLVDGGQGEQGEPYIVMEFVSGFPIDSYCQMKSLGLAERLRLFIDVCNAVHYAHQRLVVHRDLKPSNVLVNDEGQVKLLDFGIAKLLDPERKEDGEAGANPTIANAMTPAYASPEQVKGEAITTASDVYALGVLLYRLLTGESPYRANTAKPLELAKEIVETDPLRPSTRLRQRQRPREGGEASTSVPTLDTARLTRSLRGDLDNIVLMALRKEPSRRYASAEQFADDINRYLRDQPVRASADGWAYRTRKFLSRNRWSTAFAASAVVALIGGISATAYQAKVARDAQLRAETLFADVRKLANSYLFEVHDAVRGLPGATPVREMLVKNSLTYLDRLAQDAASDPALMVEIASGYDRLGDVQGAWRSASLGDVTGAEASFRKAISLRERAVALFAKQRDSKQMLESERLLIVNHGKLSELLLANGRAEEGLREAERALSLSEALADRAETSVADRLNVARSRFSLASQRVSNGQFEAAMPELTRSVEEVRQLHSANPTDALLTRVGAAMFNQAGVFLSQHERLREAKLAFTEAARLTELNVTREPRNPQFVRMSNFVRMQAAEVGYRLRERSLDDALTTQRESLQSAIGLAAADPKNQRYAMDVPLVRQWVADKLAARGETEAALAMLSLASDELAIGSERGNDPILLANTEAVRQQRIAILASAISRDPRSALARAACTELASSEATRASASPIVKAESLSLLLSVEAFHNVVAEAKRQCEAA